LNAPTSEPLATAKYLFETLGNSIDADTYCKSIVHFMHEQFGAIASFLTRLDKEAKIRWLGRYGYETDALNVATLSVWENSASAKSILTGKTIAVANTKEYQHLFGDPQLEHPSGKGFLVIPLQHRGQAIGALGMSFARDISQEILDEPSFEILAIGASAYLMTLTNRNEPTAVDTEPLEDARITSRDIQILNLMNEGLTHYEIGRVLDLSESTIKQTSSYLYKKLGVTKKLDAIDQAKTLRLI
jgi:DNA-binding CsgD family transcriptional regulator